MLTKEEILKEVQKWSEENYGLTPSEKVINIELRISRGEWIAYWDKITDLQKEAGLKGNKFEKDKYFKEDLCELFIKFIRESGRIPTRAFLDHKHKQNPDFPDSGTFYKRLGQHKNGVLVSSILEHIKNKKGYGDIIEKCNSAKNSIKYSEVEHYSSVSEVGYIYLLKTKLLNSVAYKIGKAKDVEQRLRQLKQASNSDELIHEIHTDDMAGVERYWLERFKSKKLYPNKPDDEWFRLGPSDVYSFKRWKRIF